MARLVNMFAVTCMFLIVHYIYPEKEMNVIAL